MSRLSRTAPRLLAVLGLSLLFVACGGKQLPPLENVAHPDLAGVEEAVGRQVGNARSALDKAVAKGEPEAASAAYGALGELYAAYGWREPAAASLRNAETLDPASFVWPYELGLLARGAGDYAAARPHFERALAKNPGYGPAQAHLAEALLASGDAAAAKALQPQIAGKSGFDAFAQALETGAAGAPLGVAFPDPVRERIAGLALSGGSLIERGNQALADGRLGDAEATFRRGIEANPANTELRLALARTLSRQGRDDDAIATLREAIARDEKNLRAYHELGALQRTRSQNDEAMATFREAIALAPNDAAAHLDLAEILVVLQRWDEAAPLVDKAVALAPQDPRTRYLQAMVLRGKGQNGAAIDQLRALAAQDPSDKASRQALTDSLAAAGKTAEAIEVYRSGAMHASTSKEDAVRLLDDAAKLAWKKGLRDQAVLLWRQAVERDPSSSPAHLNLGNGLQLLNRRDEAKTELGKAVELNPQDANARLSLAALRILTGDFAEARKSLEEGLTLKADEPALMNTLARLLATCPDSSLRDGRRAFELSQRAFALEAKLENAETVGMALAEMGQFEQAIRWQRGLAQQAQARGDRQALTRIVGILRTYEKRQPIRATIKS